MSFTILTESYGRRLPKITAEADSTDDLTALGTDYAEGSTCEISDTTYKLDKVKGWIDPSSGGGGGGDDGLFPVRFTLTFGEGDTPTVICDKTFAEINAEVEANGFENMLALYDFSETNSGGTATTIEYSPADLNPATFSFSFWVISSTPGMFSSFVISITSEEEITFGSFSTYTIEPDK